MSLYNKFIGILVLTLIVAMSVFAFMWRVATDKLEDTTEKLKTSQAALETALVDKSNLLEYITKKESELDKIQKEYTSKLNDIPVDKCGDTKPGQELLEYFRNNENENSL